MQGRVVKQVNNIKITKDNTGIFRAYDPQDNEIIPCTTKYEMLVQYCENNKKYLKSKQKPHIIVYINFNDNEFLGNTSRICDNKMVFFGKFMGEEYEDTSAAWFRKDIYENVTGSNKNRVQTYKERLQKAYPDKHFKISYIQGLDNDEIYCIYVSELLSETELKRKQYTLLGAYIKAMCNYQNKQLAVNIMQYDIDAVAAKLKKDTDIKKWLLKQFNLSISDLSLVDIDGYNVLNMCGIQIR